MRIVDKKDEMDQISSIEQISVSYKKISIFE